MNLSYPGNLEHGFKCECGGAGDNNLACDGDIEDNGDDDVGCGGDIEADGDDGDGIEKRVIEVDLVPRSQGVPMKR